MTSASPLTVRPRQMELSVYVCVWGGGGRRDIIIMCVHIQSDRFAHPSLAIQKNLQLQLKNIQRPRNKTMHVHGRYNSVMCSYSLDISFLDVTL